MGADLFHAFLTGITSSAWFCAIFRCIRKNEVPRVKDHFAETRNGAMELFLKESHLIQNGLVFKLQEALWLRIVCKPLLT